MWPATTGIIDREERLYGVLGFDGHNGNWPHCLRSLQTANIRFRGRLICIPAFNPFECLVSSIVDANFHPRGSSPTRSIAIDHRWNNQHPDLVSTPIVLRKEETIVGRVVVVMVIRW